MTDHDPGDEDRGHDGPWCVRCGDAFDGPERDCPNPAPGRPYVDCGRGGHMFLASEPVELVDFQTAIPSVCATSDAVASPHAEEVATATDPEPSADPAG